MKASTGSPLRGGLDVRGSKAIQMVKQPVSVNGVVRWKDVGLADQAKSEQKERKMVVLRHEIGDVLRDVRQRQGRTLREVSHSARVSLGYLSEVERGQKEASSELLSSICSALDVPLSIMLREVSDRVAVAEGVAVPDTVPQEFAQRYGRDLDRELNTELNDELAKGLFPAHANPAPNVSTTRAPGDAPGAFPASAARVGCRLSRRRRRLPRLFLREAVPFIGRVELGDVAGEGLQFLHRPFPSRSRKTSRRASWTWCIFSSPLGVRRMTGPGRRAGPPPWTPGRCFPGKRSAGSRRACPTPMLEASSVSRMGPCAADDGQQAVGCRFHVRVDLPRELLGNRAAAPPEQADLVFDGGQGGFCGILGAAGIPGVLGWVAHGNHSRVRHRERLYRCESVTFGDLWTTNSGPGTPASSAAPWSSPESAGARRTRPSVPASRPGRSGWPCARSGRPARRRLGRDVKPR